MCIINSGTFSRTKNKCKVVTFTFKEIRITHKVSKESSPSLNIDLVQLYSIFIENKNQNKTKCILF